MHVTYGEIVTNRLVPNLVGGGQTNEKTSPERLACLVDYYDKLSNLLDAICALNIFFSFIEGKQFN